MKTLLTWLGFDAQKHSVKVEMMAGLTTFLTMSYILAVNPIILGDAGMEKGAVFSATVIAAVVATMVMAFYAKMPFALASGMGLNAYFAYTLVIVMGYTWQEALAAVLLEGIFFILLTVLKIREAIVNSIPLNIRYSISVGIGLFIAFIGLKNGGIIVVNNATVTGLGPWTPASVVAISGILLGAILLKLKVRGALFYTILIMTVVGIPFGVTHIPENFTILSVPHSIEPIALKMDFTRFVSLDVEYYIVVATLLFMDLFDTLGTLIGASAGAGMVDKETGEIYDSRKLLAMIDDKKLEEYTGLMGYYQIRTSELDMPDTEVIDKYHGLSRIENQFQEMKGPLGVRPVYVNTEEHIYAHLLTCMIALVMLRLIQRKYLSANPVPENDKRNWTYGVTGSQVQNALKKWNVIPMQGDSFWFANVDDPDLAKLLDSFDIQISKKLYSDGEIRKLKKNIQVF